MLFANATGNVKRQKQVLYTEFLPYVSDSDPTSNGPKPGLKGKVLVAMERMETSCETR